MYWFTACSEPLFRAIKNEAVSSWNRAEGHENATTGKRRKIKVAKMRNYLWPHIVKNKTGYPAAFVVGGWPGVDNHGLCDIQADGRTVRLPE